MPHGHALKHCNIKQPQLLRGKEIQEGATVMISKDNLLQCYLSLLCVGY